MNKPSPVRSLLPAPINEPSIPLCCFELSPKMVSIWTGTSLNIIAPASAIVLSPGTSSISTLCHDLLFHALPQGVVLSNNVANTSCLSGRGVRIRLCNTVTPDYLERDHPRIESGLLSICLFDLFTGRTLPKSESEFVAKASCITLRKARDEEVACGSFCAFAAVQFFEWSCLFALSLAPLDGGQSSR